ncbi:MAG: response regulator transcription factor [Myxococcota bacterium]
MTIQAPTQILLVEDDDELAELLAQYLGQHEFDVARAASGDEGARQILSSRPDLVILDLMLPVLNGLDVCREVRSQYAGPIVMLTASQSEADHVAGLELGADDFVIKPIEPRVLLARLRAQLRRVGAGPETAPDAVLKVGVLKVDLGARDVMVDSEPVPLTSMEFEVLARLAKDAGGVVKRDDLYTEVLGVAYDGLDRGLDVHVSRIRRKLEHAGYDTTRLKAIRGVGYLLAAR